VTGGILRVPLASPKVIGVANSRGNRRCGVISYLHSSPNCDHHYSHQEDFYSFATLSLDPEELRQSVKKAHGVDWDPQKVGDAFSGQAVFIGIYDGCVSILDVAFIRVQICRHGGSAVSQYLRQELHGIFESVVKSSIPELFAWIKELGGYFKRFKGGALSPWVHSTENTPVLDLEARATGAFFEVSLLHTVVCGVQVRAQVDRNLSTDDVAQSCGATASVAILHSLDAPATPFFSAQQLALTVAHCG
jgi:protein phosphatase PTC6